jgi:murein DD-endopeptidase MepM/ murein hydrolase activator NlpD
MFNYSLVIQKNREQQKEISTFNKKSRFVQQAISELEKSDADLRKQLGLKSRQSRMKLTSSLESSAVSLSLLEKKVVERRNSLEQLSAWVNVVRARLAQTPSNWPIYGRIVSCFGYRSYPWRGYHTGLDIDARYGSPVRATANGTVSFTGWRRGYGKTVVVDHGHGVTTLYAHNSGYAVIVGERVRKGQVLSYVGTTGYTTGPHAHYEVRKWDRPVNPVAYLNLNILSASRIWGE